MNVEELLCQGDLYYADRVLNKLAQQALAKSEYKLARAYLRVLEDMERIVVETEREIQAPSPVAAQKQHGMGWPDAQLAANAMLSIRRAGWAPGVYVAWRIKDTDAEGNLMHIDPYLEMYGGPYNDPTNWLPSHHDLWATDWELYTSNKEGV